MKKLVILLAVVLVGCQTEPQSEKVLSIQDGQFAFCGASAAVPTGKKITIQGKEFDEGCAICTVLEGPGI